MDYRAALEAIRAQTLATLHLVELSLALLDDPAQQALPIQTCQHEKKIATFGEPSGQWFCPTCRMSGNTPAAEGGAHHG